jgi:hypothetical protein
MADQIDAMAGFTMAVEKLTIAFPTLRLRSSIDQTEPHIQAVASIPPQDGVEYGIGFILVGDELHLEIGTTNFYVPWFPSTDRVVVENFVDAVAGFIEGRHRVLETYIGEHVVKAELQAPNDSKSWRTIATGSTLLAFIPWRRRRVVVRNTASKALHRSTTGA